MNDSPGDIAAISRAETPTRIGHVLTSSYGSGDSAASPSSTSTFDSLSLYSKKSKGFEQHYAPKEHPALVEAVDRFIGEGNVDQLARLAIKTGLPAQSRAKAWPLLLASHPYVTQPSIWVSENSENSVKVPHKRIAGDVKRLMQKQKMDKDCAMADSVVNAVTVFLEKHGDKVRYESALVWIAYSLADIMETPLVDPLFFNNAMLVFCHAEPENVHTAVTAALSRFMAAFRAFLPELSAHFDHENMLNFFAGEEWLVWWIKWFGVKVYRSEDLSRLWDMYFGYRSIPELGDDETLVPLALTESAPCDPRKLHIFNCLSIMRASSDKLMDLDQSETRHMLSHMPRCRNLEAVLVQASGMLSEWEAYKYRRSGSVPTIPYIDTSE